MAYIVLVIIIVLAELLRERLHWDKVRKDRLFLGIVIFSCALLMGVRGGEVGVDTNSYQEIFDNISKSGFWDIVANRDDSRMEIGYALLMKVCSCIINNYFFFQIVVSFLFCFGMGKFIRDNSENIVMSTVIFVGSGIFLQAFGITRQYLAVVLVANSWTYLKEKRVIRSSLLIILAATVHNSAILFFIAIVVYLLKEKKLLLNLAPIAIVIVALNYEGIINAIISLSGDTFEKYNMYLGNSLARISAGGITVMWIIIGILSIYVVYQKSQISSSQKIEAIFSFSYVIFSFLGIYFNYADRVGYYFMPFILLTFPVAQRILNRIQLKRIYTAGVYVCFIALFLISGLGSGNLQYTTFF